MREPPCQPAGGIITFLAILQFDYVGSLRAAISFNDVKLYALPFFKSAESIRLNRREMDKYIVSAFPLNESETFFCVKPFYSALHENSTTLSFVKNWDDLPCV